VEGSSIPKAVEDVRFVLYLPNQSDVCVSDDGSQVMDPRMLGDVFCSPIAHGGPGFFKHCPRVGLVFSLLRAIVIPPLSEELNNYDFGVFRFHCFLPRLLRLIFNKHSQKGARQAEGPPEPPRATGVGLEALLSEPCFLYFFHFF